MYKVSSEIFSEKTNYETVKTADGKALSQFRFSYPCEQQEAAELDKDGDLIVARKKPGSIAIEHSEATEIKLVGLQVWRGALLLADFFFSRKDELKDKQILELGAGVGLTSIAAAIYAQNVICTDVDIGGILDLIRRNVQHNKHLYSGRVQVMEYDFMQDAKQYADELQMAIKKSDIVVAADVIYDDDLTNAFIRVLDTIFDYEKLPDCKSKVVYVALEKRFVFTFSELDAVAPMFEYFLKQTERKAWKFEYIPLDFPQYFQYERCKQLILLKLTSR